MGLRLAEMAANIPSHMINGTVILEDVYITGFLRERIEGARVEQLAGGLSGYLWNNHLSKGPYTYDICKIFEFLGTPPPCHTQNHATSLPFIWFLYPPPPPTVDVI